MLKHVPVNNSHCQDMQDFEVLVSEIHHLNKMEKQSGKTACHKKVALISAVLPEVWLESKDISR